MPWLPVYATEADLDMLFQWLNEDDDIAFIVADGPGRWIARKQISRSEETRYCLWHVPSGRLPLTKPGSGGRGRIVRIRKWTAGVLDAVVPGEWPREPGTGWVANPWKGWRELRRGAEPTQPWFGPGHPGIIWFNVAVQTQEDTVPISSFEWIGNHYRPLGRGAKKVTEQWWQSMRRRLNKAGSRVLRGGRGLSLKLEMVALPGALSALQHGAEGALNPPIG